MTRRRSVRSGFEQRLLANLRACDLSGQRAVIGFSGGSDSLALAAAMSRLRPLLELDLLLVHIDHRLRTESHLDAEQCRKLALALDLPIRVIELPWGLADRSRGLGIEEQGRRERYLALASAASDWGTDVILTAHQANDQAETVLLHLFRGSGLPGLAGMRLAEERPIPWWEPTETHASSYRIVRPLLREARPVIERYLDESGLVAVHDASNVSVDFDRNWIRQQVLPRIEERWPAVVETLARSAEAARMDTDFLDQLTANTGFTCNAADRTIRTHILLDLDRAIAYRSIRRWLIQTGVEEIDQDVVARIYDLALAGDPNIIVEAGSNVRVLIADGELVTESDLLETAARTVAIDTGDPRSTWRIEIGPAVSDSPETVFIPDDEPISVRSLRPGDRWYGTRRTVAEDLRAAGIHPRIRPHLLAVMADRGVLLIPAIYPTIRAKLAGIQGTEAGIRWQRRQ